ncbi:N/A [soil metagenome]
MTLALSLFKMQFAAVWQQPRRTHAVILAICVSILFGATLGSARSFTYHESHIVQGAREMLVTGDCLIPRVGGRPWLEKPPLPQWLVAVSGSLFGHVNEFAARLPAALCGLLGVLAFSGLISRCRGERVGLIAGILLATSTSIITYARLAEPDIFLWGIIVTALCVFASQQVEVGSITRSSMVFFLLLGLTQTVKGPLFGAVLTLAPCCLWLAWHRGQNWKWLASPLGWLACIGVTFAWPVAVIAQFPEALTLWREHTFGRLDGTNTLNTKPFWYYLSTLPWQAAPAFLLALPALPQTIRNAIQQPKSLDRFLMVWFGSMFVLLSAASGKHHHYLLHALPPWAFWATAALPWWGRRVAALWNQRWYRVLSPVLFAAFIGVAAWQVGQRGSIAAWEIVAIGVTLQAGLTLMAVMCGRGNDTAAATAFLLTLMIVTIYANVAWLGRNDIYAEDAALARRLTAMTTPDDVILVYKIDPARLLLDLPRRVIVVNDASELPAAVRPGMYVLTVVLIEEEFLKQVPGQEVDRTPHPKWAGSLISHTVLLKTKK